MEQNFEEMIKSRVTEVFHIMEQRVTPEEMTRIRAAYELAYEAHRLQKRKSGEPYIIHPIAVARIVADELKLGANPVMAAFLHDVVEDTIYTLDDIKERFGEDVAFLVSVVTKRKKEHYEMSKQLDNFKQMLDSLHYDIRAILLKLADRLHNMRTLDSMRPDKQMKIAGETDYFYAPLANRLGLYRIKTELENLSMRYRCPHEYERIADLLRADRESNKASLQFFTQKLKDILTSHGYDVRVEVNYRMPYSLWRKMKKENKDFHHIEHRHFVNVIFPDGLMWSEKNTCLQIYSILTERNNFEEKPGGISNYIDHPKENGYQSFHMHLLNDHGKWEEVHICSERMVRNSSLGCVAERTEDNIRNWIENFRLVLRDIARNCREDDFIDSVVSSFYNDDITVYTPKGTPIVLPQRATALDFAFAVHSDIGKCAKYARVNGSLCSLRKVLKRGDCVEIGYDDKYTPQPEWQDFVITYKAKRFLKNYFSERMAMLYARCPFCKPMPGDEVIGFTESDNSITVHRRDCPKAVRLATQYGDSIVSVDFKENPNILYPVSIRIKAVDRFHLLHDVIDCITENLNLSIDGLSSETNDSIVNCTICFRVHSFVELRAIINNIARVKGVDEVQRESLG